MTCNRNRPTISELPIDRQRTELSGRPSHGSCGDSFFSHTRRTGADAFGVAISRLLSNMTIGLSTEQKHILTSLPPDASLCACPATELNGVIRFCVLDAEGKVIIAFRAMFVGTAEMIRKILCDARLYDSDYGEPVIELSIINSIPQSKSWTPKPVNGSPLKDRTIGTAGNNR